MCALYISCSFLDRSDRNPISAIIIAAIATRLMRLVPDWLFGGSLFRSPYVTARAYYILFLGRDTMSPPLRSCPQGRIIDRSSPLLIGLYFSSFYPFLIANIMSSYITKSRSHSSIIWKNDLLSALLCSPTIMPSCSACLRRGAKSCAVSDVNSSRCSKYIDRKLAYCDILGVSPI